MDLATGAMGSLLPKLVDLLKEEYNLQKGVRKDGEFLENELRSINAALGAVGEVPWYQLDEQVRVWADEVRELSYTMEDVVDSFLVRVDGPDPVSKPKKVKWLKEKIGDLRSLFTKGKTRHQIGDKIKDIKKKVNEVAERRRRYELDGLVTKPTAATKIDPRVWALYTDVTELVGIDGKRDLELINLLDGGDPNNKLKVVSVVGFGGLGKTTLVQAVYKKIKSAFDSSAFVPVGRSAHVKKVLRDILFDLKCSNNDLEVLDERQLIDQVRTFLENKRYLIVIDDIWDKTSWEIIKCAFPHTNEMGSQIITTTRIVDVAKVCCSYRDDLIFQMQPLTSEESERLFHRRIEHPFGREPEFEKVTEDILKKCGGVPLAIITIASVLAGDGQIKPINEWYELLGSVGCGLTEASGVKEMHMILSYSYYDLPPHLKSCLLYLSIFPEDHKIDKDQLIWRWIAEGFICEETVTRLFEVGEGYYNNLINKGLIQPVFEGVFVGTAEACRVHDMVLDLICFLTRKDNLVTIRNVTEDNMSSQKIARRLSLQKEDHGSASSMSVSQVRSITVFPSAVNIMPPLSSFDVLRVLDLSRCRLATNSLLGVGNLSQLRYLSLEATGIRELPLEIGRLQALRVLDISRNYGLYELPCFVCKITTLMCLVMGYLDVEVPDGFGDLISLEVVKQMEGSRDTIKELFNLTRLRELNIRVKNLGSEMEEAFVEHLGKLKKFQCLWLTGRFASMDLFGERWEPTHHLRMLLLEGRLSALPGWIKRNPMLYSNLSCLHLKLNGLQQEDMRVLGRLPALGELYLNSIDQAPLIYIDSFPQMVFFNLRCSAPGQILCHPGALPRAEIVKFSSVIPMGWFRAADFDFGLRYLLCLRKVVVTVIYSATVCYADKVSAHAALKKAVGTHPNHPLFDLGFETAAN